MSEHSADYDVAGMLSRANRPHSGQCVVCGNGEHIGHPHLRCQIGLIRYVASLRCECCQGRCSCGGKRVIPTAEGDPS